MNKITRVELIRALINLGLSEPAARNVVETVWQEITAALTRGDKVVLPGFGTFRVARRRPRLARNPRTGVRVQVPAKKVVTFQASRELKKYLNTPTREDEER